MMRELNDGPKSLRINGANLAPGKTLADYPRKFSPEKVRPLPSPCLALSHSDFLQLAEWGFDCHAIDLIDGPPQVLAWLCETLHLHEMVREDFAPVISTSELTLFRSSSPSRPSRARFRPGRSRPRTKSSDTTRSTARTRSSGPRTVTKARKLSSALSMLPRS